MENQLVELPSGDLVDTEKIIAVHPSNEECTICFVLFDNDSLQINREALSSYKYLKELLLS